MSCKCEKPEPVEVTEEDVAILPMFDGEHVLAEKTVVMCNRCHEDIPDDRVPRDDHERDGR